MELGKRVGYSGVYSELGGPILDGVWQVVTGELGDDVLRELDSELMDRISGRLWEQSLDRELGESLGGVVSSSGSTIGGGGDG